jgi:predicted esterase YcpF (UPF0227 family)
MSKKPILITLHGGCFVGGSASWDQQQTKCLESLGFDVHQLEFPKDNFKETIEYIFKYIKDLKESVYILGRSSGGFLAKVIHDFRTKLIKKVIYLAPVFNPELRAKINIQFKEKQDYYFRDTRIIPNTDTFDKETELIILATHDENVPKECFTDEQLRNAIYLGIKTHKGILGTTSTVFKTLIKDNLK